MELTEISPKMIDDYLQAFRMGREKSAGLLALHCVDFPHTRDIEEKHLWLYAWLEAQINKNLAHYRGSQNPSIQYPTLHWQQALRLDFQNMNTNLQSWSALHYRYFSGETDSFETLAQVADYEPRQFRRRLENGLKELSTLVQRLEMEAHQRDKPGKIGHSIPNPDYNQLFGIQAAQAQVHRWLVHAEGPQMVSIEGIGGIGKTMLARSTLEYILKNDVARFRDLIWVSAQQEMLTPKGEIEKLSQDPPTLNGIVSGVAHRLGLSNLTGLNIAAKLDGIQHTLNLHPYLIVIDNLENVQEVRTLVPMFRKIAGKSHFIFTSRRTLRAFPYVQVFPVPQLSEQDSQKLIEAEVNRRGKTYQLTPQNAEKIFAVVGGLPLALKLIAAQIFDLSEEYVLKRLNVFASGKSHKALYTYIYKETWNNLDELAKHLLLSMLLVSQSGDLLEWVQTNSGLLPEEFERAFAQLLDFSLIEINQHLHERGYYLHRLTQTFLKSNILGEWDD